MKKPSPRASAKKGPPNVLISLRLKPHIHARLKELSDEKGPMVSALIQMAIAEYIERQTKA